MRPELISACQLFLVPSAIMFAALGVAGSEGLKTVIRAMGAATSDIWIWTVYRWKDVMPADPHTVLPPSDTKPVLVLSILFAVAWGICFCVHLCYGWAYGFERQKEAQVVFLRRRSKARFARLPKPAKSSRYRRQRLWRRLRLPVRSWWTAQPLFPQS
jgi:hypothetical protein